MTYLEFINQQKIKAENVGKEPEAIKLLVLELSGYKGAEFVLHLHSKISEELQLKMEKAIESYLEGIPIQHILGYSYFFGYKITVNPQVLIPRPETEELVEKVLTSYDEIFKGKKVDVVDLGTGSGAIAIALAKEEPNMNVYATDISYEALNVAKLNARGNQAEVNFLHGSWLKPLIQDDIKVDIIVSNPPYIPNKEEVDPLVKDNEPHLALFGGKEGLDFYEEILKDASKVLRIPSMIAFEHSYNKKAEMIQLAKKYFPNQEVIDFTDLNGKDRILLIKIKKDVK